MAKKKPAKKRSGAKGKKKAGVKSLTLKAKAAAKVRGGALITKPTISYKDPGLISYKDPGRLSP